LTYLDPPEGDKPPEARQRPPTEQSALWHHNPEAPPEHLCEECDYQSARVAELEAALEAMRSSVATLALDLDRRVVALLARPEPQP
jgi:hypothetical protein